MTSKTEKLKCAYEYDVLKYNIQRTSNVHEYSNELDSLCETEKRYTARYKYHWSVKTEYVHCFDCIVKSYCVNENCTNPKHICQFCYKINNNCFDCYKNTKYDGCCQECSPCSICFKHHEDEEQEKEHQWYRFDKAILECCSFCGKDTCCLDVHKLLECEKALSPAESLCVTKKCIKYLCEELAKTRLRIMEVDKSTAENYCNC